MMNNKEISLDTTVYSDNKIKHILCISCNVEIGKLSV